MNSTSLKRGELPFLASLTPIFEKNQIAAWFGFWLLAIAVLLSKLPGHRYKGIPAIGPTNFLSSWKHALKFSEEGNSWLTEGYKKYKSSAFRIPSIARWQVVIAGRDLVEEYRRARDVFNFPAAVDENLQAKYMLGPTIMSNRYHVNIVRNQLTRHLGVLFDDIRDEITKAMDDNIPLSQDWIQVKAYPAIVQIVARTSNRIFVGEPLCRDPDFTDINIQHALFVGKGARILMWFPSILKPLAAKFLTSVPDSVERAVKHLRPLIEERQKKIEEYGKDYPGKPMDLLSWLLDEAEGEERTTQALTNRIIHLNFAAIHTSSMSFTHALYHLAAQPNFIQPLREEVESIVKREGWSKASLSKMRRLDSLFKESQRFNGISYVSLQRKALKDYTFSDGTFVPKGALVYAAAFDRHHDNDVYEDADAFDPFRFSKIRDQGGLSTTNQLVNTNPDYISFGHGTHACPGRFFVANEMKLMMAYLILEYDFKTKKEGVRPPNIPAGFSVMPDMEATILFRRRST